MSILFNDPEFDFMFVVMSSPSVVYVFLSSAIYFQLPFGSLRRR